MTLVLVGSNRTQLKNVLLLWVVLCLPPLQAIAHYVDREQFQMQRAALRQILQELKLSDSVTTMVLEKSDSRFIHIQIIHARENFFWLQKVGVKNPGALIEKFPPILGYSINENLEPKILWLQAKGVKNPGAFGGFPQLKI